MFLFISYTLPTSPSTIIDVAFDWSIDRCTMSTVELLNSTFDILNITADNLLHSGYVASEPMKDEDIWVYVNLNNKTRKKA